jgi:chaperone modulatory protein CbpM
MANITVTTASTVSAEQPLRLSELAHACGADTAWVVRLVEIGIVQTTSAEPQPERWQFAGSELQCALQARRLERDFGVNLDAAALILDLQHEVRRLKSMLRTHGLGPTP